MKNAPPPNAFPKEWDEHDVKMPWTETIAFQLGYQRTRRIALHLGILTAGLALGAALRSLPLVQLCLFIGFFIATTVAALTAKLMYARAVDYQNRFAASMNVREIVETEEKKEEVK